MVCAILAIGLMFAFFWGLEVLEIRGVWRLYLLINSGIFVVAGWRTRKWFTRAVFVLGFLTWTVTHFLVSAITVLVHLSWPWIWWLVFFAIGAKLLKDYMVQRLQISASDYYH